MMEENNKMSYSWVVPALAVLVILQAVVIAPSNRVIPHRQNQASRMKIEPFTPVPVKEGQAASVVLFFDPSELALKKGRTATVDIILDPKRELKLDGADIVLGFDPKVLAIEEVIAPKLFSFVFKRNDRQKEGRISVTFLEEKQNGLLLKERVKVLTLQVKAIAAGTSAIAVLTSKEGPTTVLTESGTSRKIIFERTNLPVLVY